MKQNYQAPCLTVKTYETADVLTESTEYGVSWGTTGWGSSNSSTFGSN